MSDTVTIARDRQTLTVRVPFEVQKRGGRKLVITPDGGDWAPLPPQIDNTLVKALARAFRWKRMFETGNYASLAELAAAEKINASYMCRMLRLTLLAPELVEAILDGRRAASLRLERLLRLAVEAWQFQVTILAAAT
jgi:hypothetical protein